MSRTLRRRCKIFFRSKPFYTKEFRDSKGMNFNGPHFFRQWFTKTHRLKWNQILRDKNFDYDVFVSPIRELGYWW